MTTPLLPDPGASRIPLLLLPGLLNDATLWRHQIAGLADIADCRVGDLTGHDSLRAVTQAVLAAAPPRFALAGFSLGGYVAQEILRIAPQRVQRLALLGSSFHADSPERVARRLAQQATVRMAGSFHGFGERLMRSYIDVSRLQDRALVDAVRAMTTRLGAQVFARQSRIERVDGRAVLRGYRDPLLVVCGQNDVITPPAISREIAAMAAQAQLLVLPHCGHLAPLEQPEAVLQAMRRWLRA
ncbi:alpha/beta fold hydrolase [Stenotrophomonas sp. YIM B06876]|uniref:alpha/beta fold hydrolase n=1 Tax=Stenotrophomonas sp. YIM B06876 TaxID=3060211 RepID=UPI002739E42F|nr:alpha/beta fold hydrolase [Stenotrophomonas sp. YIM B06876]